MNHIAFRMELAAQQGDLDQAKDLLRGLQPEFDRLTRALEAVDWDDVAS